MNKSPMFEYILSLYCEKNYKQYDKTANSMMQMIEFYQKE